MSALTAPDCSEKWDLQRWYSLWASEDYLDWRRRWIEGMDKSEAARLANEAAIAEEMAKPYWDKLVSINFDATCDVKDGLDAWTATKLLLEEKGWTVVAEQQMFPHLAGDLRILMGRNAFVWCIARRPKTRGEMLAL